jgi:hypothetical protein
MPKMAQRDQLRRPGTLSQHGAREVRQRAEAIAADTLRDVVAAGNRKALNL